jgi:DNA-binding GntR family transcriptional regulator
VTVMTGRTSRGVAQRLRDRIYESIRELVERGKLLPGQRLTESNLAARFGASRTPVREALFQLAREGLLEPLERGYALPEKSMSTVLARLGVRYLLDPAMTAHVVETGSPAQIKLIIAMANETRSMLASAQSPFALASAVHEFQKSLAAMCANPVLARCCGVAEDDFLAARPLLFRAARNRLITADYLGVLVQSMAARDALAAESQTRAFITKLTSSCQTMAKSIPVCPLNAAQGAGLASLDARVARAACMAGGPDEL